MTLAWRFPRRDNAHTHLISTMLRDTYLNEQCSRKASHMDLVRSSICSKALISPFVKPQN